jgi:NAD(P)-dependent dehydrogenase (short-subunit alcohol dehydrogenase family)
MWAGKNVVVAGATGAFGWAAAQAFAAAGATVVLTGKSIKPLEHKFDLLKATGAPEPALYPIDFLGAQGQDYVDFAERIAAELGGIDALIWGVGFWHGLEPQANVPAQIWLKTLHLNLTAPQLLLQACIPSLRARQGAALFPLQRKALTELAFTGAYGAAQAGLRNWLIGAASEHERFGPRVLGLELPPLKSRLRLAAFPAESVEVVMDASALMPQMLALLQGPERGLFEATR